jgi:predicted transcriptional regulator
VETILLSINPEYVYKILDETKKFEFRKRLADKAVNRILIYATLPIKQVVGEVQVLEAVSAPPSALWEMAKGTAGISRDKYRKYFKGCKTAYAYRLGEVIKYEPQKSLDAFGISNPPQSFIYVVEDK